MVVSNWFAWNNCAKGMYLEGLIFSIVQCCCSIYWANLAATTEMATQLTLHSKAQITSMAVGQHFFTWLLKTWPRMGLIC